MTITEPGVLTVMADVEQRSEEWYDQRRGLVTASVVGQLITVRAKSPIEYDCPACGAFANFACISKRGSGDIKTTHPERSQDDGERVIEAADGREVQSLTLLLAAERITGYTEPTYISSDMWRGIEDEPLARDHYAAHHAPVETCGFMVREFGAMRLGYSPDGLVGDDGLIEIKSRRQKKQLETVLANEVPAENMAQIQCGLLVSGRAWCDYLSWCGGMPMWPIRVYPDERWFAAITEAVEKFEAAVEQMCSTYLERVEGLPATERVNYDVELKL